MDLKSIKVSVDSYKYVKNEDGTYNRVYRANYEKYDEEEILNLIEQDYVERNGLPRDEEVHIYIDSIEIQ